MLIDEKQSEILIFNDSEGNNILFTHSVFAQCTLPLRSLPKGTDIYEVSHGKSFLNIQASYLRDNSSNKSIKQEIPAGPKARLLFTYINDQAIRTGKAEIDMGKSLRNFMTINNIPLGGKNANEIEKQIRNIAAAHIHLGVWGDNGNKTYTHQENIRIAKGMTFWTEKDPKQVTFWQPTMTLSDEYMAALEHHRVPVDFECLVALQSNPRAMDLYVWLSYRIRTVRVPVSITWKSLHEVFGSAVADIKTFKRRFKDALKLAVPYVKNLEIDMDSKHLKLINTSRKFVSMSDTKKISASVTSATKKDKASKSSMLVPEGINLSDKQLAMINRDYSETEIKEALAITEDAIHKKGGLENPAAYFMKAITEGYKLPEDKKKSANVTFDIESFLETIPEVWRKGMRKIYDKFGDKVFRGYFSDIRFIVDHQAGELILTTTKVQRDYLLNNCKADLESAWELAGIEKKFSDDVIKVLAKDSQ